jgi:hypothetical protein
MSPKTNPNAEGDNANSEKQHPRQRPELANVQNSEKSYQIHGGRETHNNERQSLRTSLASENDNTDNEGDLQKLSAAKLEAVKKWANVEYDPRKCQVVPHDTHSVLLHEC